MPAKKKEGTYRPLVDDYLHSWYVVHVDMKTHKFSKLFKNSFTYKKIIYTTLKPLSSTSQFAEDRIV